MAHQRLFGALAAFVFVTLPLLPSAGCLDAKHGCRTDDDCADGRVCVAGTCQVPVLDANRETTTDERAPIDAGHEAFDASDSVATDAADAVAVDAVDTLA